MKNFVRDLIEKGKAIRRETISTANFNEASKLHREAMAAWDVVTLSNRPRYRGKYTPDEVFQHGMRAFELEFQAMERLRDDPQNLLNYTILTKSACFMALHFGFARDALDIFLTMLLQHVPEDLRGDCNEIIDGIFAQLFPSETDGTENADTPPGEETPTAAADDAPKIETTDAEKEPEWADKLTEAIDTPETAPAETAPSESPTAAPLETPPDTVYVNLPDKTESFPADTEPFDPASIVINAPPSSIDENDAPENYEKNETENAVA